MHKKVKGVGWDKRCEKWMSRITTNGKTEYLGHFDSYDEAVVVRKEAEIKSDFVPIIPALNLKHRNDLTQEMLKERLNYDPETGIFTWKVKTGKKIKIGSIAGSIDKRGYLTIAFDKKQYKTHRLVFLYMTGDLPEDNIQVDHINHVRDDNRWVNLRLVTHQGNMRNSSMRKDNTSGYAGVHWNKRDKIWNSRIKANGEIEHLGNFKNKEEAVAARKAAEIKYNYHENHGNQRNQTKEVA